MSRNEVVSQLRELDGLRSQFRLWSEPSTEKRPAWQPHGQSASSSHARLIGGFLYPEDSPEEAADHANLSAIQQTLAQELTQFPTLATRSNT
eukprot:5243900-Amphidinium_carterae.1